MTQPLPEPERLSPDLLCYRNVMVAMRDGIRLATDLYLPAGQDVPRHAILERTPYGKHKPSRAELRVGDAAPMPREEIAAHYCAAGYAFVTQDCRGRYRSEGSFTKYVAEAEDGFDTIAWIAAQRWCAGKVVTTGLSYAAHTQMAAACLAPPALAGMVIDSGGFSNAFQCGIRQGGAFELKQATWAWNQAKDSRDSARDPAVQAAIASEDIRGWFKRMPWSEGNSPIRWAPDYEAYLLDQWQRGSFDDYWKSIGVYAAGYYDRIPDIPVLLLSSWYDVYVPATLENFAGLDHGAHRPRMIMGPWIHGDRTKRIFGDVDFGPNALFDGNVGADWNAYRIACFNHWLKDTPSPEAARVRLFLMGGGSGCKTPEGKLDHGGQWIAASQWPLPDARATDLYLHANGRLSPELPTASDACLRYDFDPRNPVPTIGGALTSGRPVFEGGAYDQREDARFFGCRDFGMPLSARADVLAFETEPLEEDIAIIGPVEVELWISSDAPDTDFTAKLIDVHPPSPDYPQGFAMNLTDGIFRCRYRNSWEVPEPLQPGEIARIVSRPFATANRFRKGHRIRLDISSSNFPKFDVNPNTGAPEGMGRTFNIARNIVHLSPAHPSRLIVQTVPLSALQD